MCACIYLCVCTLKKLFITVKAVWKTNTFLTCLHFCPGKRKRSQHHQEHISILKQMQVANIEQQELNRAQRDRHVQMAIEEARLAREQEAALRAEENAQTAGFNQAFLNVMGMLVKAISGQQEQHSQPDYKPMWIPPSQKKKFCTTCMFAFIFKFTDIFTFTFF